MEKLKGWQGKAAVFLFSQMISLFGSSVVGFAVIWYITIETSSARVMAIFTISSFLPQIIISLFAGVWADRYSRKMLIMVADSITAIASLILMIAIFSDNFSYTMLFVINAIRSIGYGIQTPAVAAILPQIVPEDKLTRVNGINTSLQSVLMLLSPAVGGFLLSTLGFGYTMMVDVVTGFSAVFILIFLKVRKQKPIENPDTALGEMAQGFNYIKNHTLIRNLLIFYMIFFFLVTPAAFLTPIMVGRSYGPEVWRLTANEMFWTLGSVVGGIIISMWGGFKNKLATMTLSSVGFGISFVMIGFITNFYGYLAALFVSGIFMPIFGTAETVLIQEYVDENMLGRVFSFVQIIISAVMPLGMLVFGPLGDMFRIESIMLWTGVLLIAISPFILRLDKERK